MEVKLHRMERQAVRVRMVFAVFRQALPAEFHGPGLHRQTVGEQRRKILERPWPGSGWRTESGWRCSGGSGCHPPVPDSRQIRMAVGSLQGGRGEIRRSGHVVGRPLRPKRRRKNRQPDQMYATPPCARLTLRCTADGDVGRGPGGPPHSRLKSLSCPDPAHIIILRRASGMYLRHRHLVLPVRGTYFPSQENPPALGTKLKRPTSQNRLIDEWRVTLPRVKCVPRRDPTCFEFLLLC